MNPRRPAALAVLAGAIALTACTVGPSYRRPDLALTPAFVTPASGAPAAAPTELETWWRGFEDPLLTRVVERALAQNLDLMKVRARVLQSRAAARAAGAALMPRANASGGADDTRQSLLSPIGAIGRHLPGFQRDYDEYDLGASASWEIDLFGGLRRGRDAARADARASADAAAAVQVSLAAEAADAYLQARAYQARLATARRQEAVELDLVDLLVRRTGEGLSPDRELHAARAELEGVRATIPPLQSGLDAELNRLDVLMGAQPGTYRLALAEPAPPPRSPTASAADGPAGLLRRRPDILGAEQRLIAADARIGEAVAGYYPSLSIAGLIGLDSLDSRKLFTGDAVQHQVNAGLRWRLFDFGRVDAEVAQAKGREAEALADYRSVVLEAAEEVEDAFSDLAAQQARAAALSRQIAQLTQARAQAEAAYEGGVIGLIEVRDADRDLLAASDQLVQARAGAARAAVACYRALGGGWTAPAEPRRLAGA